MTNTEHKNIQPYDMHTVLLLLYLFLQDLQVLVAAKIGALVLQIRERQQSQTTIVLRNDYLTARYLILSVILTTDVVSFQASAVIFTFLLTLC